jgi:hypothetical protein
VVKRDLGTLGESTLVAWAAARGINAQRATNDRNGWDYLLEFPPERCGIITRPLDREPPSISCFVQVKARSSRNLNVSARLVNWHRMIKETLPTFFLILEFGDSDYPRSAYLIPIAEARISHALRRIREIDSQGESIARRKLGVIFGAEDRLDRPNGEAFESAVRKHIGPSFEEYLDKKRKWVSSVGYEKNHGNLIVNISVNAHAAPLIEPLVDLSLGLVESLSINCAELHDVRFDIPARAPLRLPEGVLEIVERPSERAEMVLAYGASVVRITMEMFIPHGLAKILDAASLRIRLESSFFDIVVTKSSSFFRFELPDADERANLGKLVDLARVLLIFDDSARRHEEIIFALHARERLMFQNSIMLSECIDPRLRELAEVLLDAWAVAKLMDIQDRVELTTLDLMLQRSRLKAARNIGENVGRMRIRGFISKGVLSEGALVKVPYGIEVLLGNYRGVVVASLWGNIRFTGRKNEGDHEFEMESSERRLENALAAKMNQEPQVDLGAAVRAIVEASSSVPCLLLSDFAAPDSGATGRTQG